MTTFKASFTMSIKIILFSTFILLFSTTLPRLLAAASSDLPTIVAAAKSWLRPPYLYFIINGIIITIVASSRLHKTNHHAPLLSESEGHAPVARNVISVGDVGVVEEVEEVKEVVTYSVRETVLPEEVVVVETVGEAWSPPPAVPRSPLVRQEPVAGFYSERPPAVSRFGQHRRPTKTNLVEGGKALRRISKPKKHDTLESTWKAITEGRHIPLTRHLKKSDTWENADRQIDLLDSSPIPEVKKSQTFTDRTNHASPRVPSSNIKLKKEPSLGQDELNRRVEAFINKFNEDMRLQRQQSMQQFMEMINRAT
ncbi:hypothetical protein vseg_009011 [Gypsophila vaccaria]